MKCVYCGYEHGWNQDSEIEGKEGKFYMLSNDVKFKRQDVYYENDEEVDSYACPKCKKVFID